LKGETPEQRAERLRKQEEEDTSLVRELPKAFDFQLAGEEVVNVRPMYFKRRRAPAINRKASAARCSPK